MANGDNENQGNLDRNTTEKYLEEQKDIMTRLQQGEEANRDELINALDEMKKEEGQDQELVTYLHQAMQQLKAFPETLAPEMYRDVLGDVIDEMSQEQASIFQSLLQEVGGLNEAMRSGFGRMSGVLSDAFAPLMELKEFTLGAFEMLKGGFDKITGIFGSVFGGREEEKQTSILGNIKNYMAGLFNTQKEQLDLQESQYRRDLRKDRTPEEGGIAPELLEMITPALTGLAFAISAAISPLIVQFKILKSSFVIPLKAMTSWLSSTRFARWVGSFIDRMGSFGRMIRNFTSYLGRSARWVGNWASKLSDLVPVLGRGARWIPIIGQVVTGIIAMVDFFRAFASEQGSYVEKIKAGLTEAITGLVRLPVQLLGWIGDWVLGLFGVEITGGMGNRVMEILRSIVGEVIDFVVNISGWIGSFLTLDTIGMQQYGQKILNQITDLLGGLIDTIVEWLKGIVPDMDDIKSQLGDVASSLNPANWGIFGGGSEERGTGRSGIVDIPEGAKKGEDVRAENESGGWFFRKGGPVKEGGMARLHAGEYVLPKSTVDRMGGFDDVDRMAQTIGQQENERRNREAQDRAREQNSLLQKLDSIERSIRSTGETTTQESTLKVEQEPPDEIESLALLIFNKSWGVA